MGSMSGDNLGWIIGFGPSVETLICPESLIVSKRSSFIVLIVFTMYFICTIVQFYFTIIVF